ncbi:MAG: zinc ribbon domain-containing protein [Dehalococcoidia bacterium]
MPIFGYRCDKCGEEFELLEPCKEEGDPPYCPHCGAFKPENSTYRICRYWRMAYGGGGEKAKYIRPGSWA